MAPLVDVGRTPPANKDFLFGYYAGFCDELPQMRHLRQYCVTHCPFSGR